MKSLFEVPISPCNMREDCKNLEYCSEQGMACKAYGRWLGSNYKDIAGAVRMELRGQHMRTVAHYENHGNTKKD